MSKIYVCGDIHGNYKGLVQAIERSPFKPQEDTLISLGDLIDGGYDSYEVVEYLSSLPDCILIKGNHDEYFKHWLNYGVNPVNWLQGQHLTAESYISYVRRELGEDRIITPNHNGYITNLIYSDIPKKHRDFLNSGINYFIDVKNNCYVHGGFNRFLPINKQRDGSIYYWDRDLWLQALHASDSEFKIEGNYNTVFIGHTSTTNWKTTKPMLAANVWNLDTGAGTYGKVTIMDVNTYEYWQSDLFKELY